MVLPASHGQPRFPWYSRTPPDGGPAFDYGALTPCGGPFQVLRLARALLRPARGSRPRTRRTTPAPQRLPAWARRGFRLLPVRSPLLGECSLLLGVLRCFSSPTYRRSAYVFSRGWRGMTPAGLPHSGIDGALPACGPPSLFAACHALHRPVSPRHPPHTGSCLSETASRPRPCPAAAREPPLATARHHCICFNPHPTRWSSAKPKHSYSAFATSGEG